MRVSVIIPAMNEAELVAGAVVSARAAGATEVIVADGGSDDATVERARQAGGDVVACPTGRAVQQNQAAARATGDVLLFLHSDCRLPATALQQLTDGLGDPRVVGGAFRQRIEADGLGYRWLEWGNAWRVRWMRQPYGDQGLFVRKEVFERLGGFPEVPLMEDLMLVRQLRRLGKLVLLPGPLLTNARRWERHGVLRQTLRNWRLLTARRLGVPLERLARYYSRHDSG